MKGIPKRGKQFYRSGKQFQKGCECQIFLKKLKREKLI